MTKNKMVELEYWEHETELARYEVQDILCEGVRGLRLSVCLLPHTKTEMVLE